MALCTSHPPTSQIYFPPTHPFAHYTPPSSPLTNLISFSPCLFCLFPVAISCACAAGQMPGQGPTWTLQPRAQCLPGLLERPVKALCASMTILVDGFS